MKLKITDHQEARELNVKRFYPPFTLASPCPECGEVATVGGDNYLLYPTLNEPMEVTFCHEGDEPEYWCHEWDVWIELTMTVVQVDNPNSAVKGDEA